MRRSEIVLIITLLILNMVIPASAQAARGSRVGYEITGRVAGREMEVEVKIGNVRALAGKLALSFDPSKLELKETKSLTDAVKNTEGTTITSEGLDASVLLSNEKGRVMFAWYATNYAGIDASEEQVTIAKIGFLLKEGVGEEAFNRNTLGLYYVNETMVDKWECSANIIGSGLVSYRNTAEEDEYVCGIRYEYPNSEYIPIERYEAKVEVKDTGGRGIEGAAVRVGKEEEITDRQGEAKFEMENGVYPYRISARGYETKSGYIIIEGASAQVTAELKSESEKAQELAEEIEIRYAEGDSEESVTTSLGLAEEGSKGEQIRWASSNEAVITNQGIVNRGEEDEKVELTATVTYGTGRAQKRFEVTVKSRQSAEEKNQGIVERDSEALEIGYAPGDSAGAVTTDITLKEVGENGSVIIWTSSDEEVVGIYGQVARAEEDREIQLEALIMRGEAQARKGFRIVVKGTKSAQELADEELVKRVIEALEIGYAAGDDASGVTKALTLVTEGVEGTQIRWESSEPGVVTAYGGVVRQQRDCEVKLRARVEKGEARGEKRFEVTVKASETIPVNPDNGTEEEINKSNAGKKPDEKPNKPDEKPEQGPFKDLGGVEWAREAIEELNKRGVIKGTSESTYSPGEPIMRRDYVTLLMRLLDLGGEVSGSGFIDVAPGEYYYEPIMRAKTLGLIEGVGEQEFNPNGYITRQDMMTLTYRVLQKLGKAEMEPAELSRFEDSEEVAGYAQEGLSRLIGGGYIKGDGQRLYPRSETTRAETAVFLYRLGL